MEKITKTKAGKTTEYKIQYCNSKIRFRTLNRNHNFIFIKNKNSILVLEPIKLVHIYSFYHNEIILDFVVSPKNSNLILCTHSFLEIYELNSENVSDYDLKIKFNLNKSILIENIQELSVSNIGDVIATINKHRVIKLFDMNLNLIKALDLEIKFYPKELELFPLDFFFITYDTKNILMCKYNNDKLSLVYKCKNSFEDNVDYKESIISLKENIVFMKEYQKSLNMYIDYQDCSLYFVTTTGLNFLILRKIFELDLETYDLVPNLIIFLYINLSTQTETIDFPYLSFSLIYDNENPIFKNDNNEKFEDYQSGIISMDKWNESKNKNTLSDDEINTFFNFNEYNLKTVSSDYIIFNFKENVILYQINGLQSLPFNNPSLDKIIKLKLDENYNSSFTLLKVTRTFDRKYSAFFIDKYMNLRKFIIKGEEGHNGFNFNDPLSENSIIYLKESRKAYTLYQNIISAEYNCNNRKSFILQIFNNDSLIIIINSKLEFSKTIIFENCIVHNIHWVKDSDFILFSYEFKERQMIGIIYIYSKIFNKKLNIISNSILESNFMLIDLNKFFREKTPKIKNIFLESQIYSNIIVDQKLKLRKNIETELLIKTDYSLIDCSLKIFNEEKDHSEFIGKFNLNWKISNEKIEREEKKWLEKEFIFSEDKIYYLQSEEETNIISIKSLDKDGIIKTIFQTVIFQKLLFSKIYFNNYIIFITSNYINSYDVLNRMFYRIRNDYIQRDGNGELEKDLIIDLIHCGVYIMLILITKKKIRLIRIPRNKNSNESFSFEFKYIFNISNVFSKVSFENDMIIFNESQIEHLSFVSKIKQNLLFNSTQQELIVLNSTSNSIFDNETFLDYFLTDNENIIKMILNIFCNLYNNYKSNFTNVYKNSKLIPNFFDGNSFDYIKKIVFENDYNSLSEKNNETDKSKNTLLNFPLTFKTEEDNQNINPIKIWCSKSSNLFHMNYIYDLISNENTRNIDNFTKYFMLKISMKKKDFEKGNFKLSTSDLCWIYLINNQQDILNFICGNKIQSINWKTMTLFNVPMWIKSDIKLKELLENVARNEYKRIVKEDAQKNENKTQEKNHTEHIALYLYLADKENLILDFYDREPQNEKIKKFVMRDFSIKKNRKIAKENADTLMNKKKYIYAAYFYLLADDIRSALDMTLEKMKDINLTICLLRLVNSKYGNDYWKKFYSLDKLYQDYFINFGTIIRDPYLVTYGFLGQNKIDSALEYILNYDNEYFFQNSKEIFDNIEDYKSNLDLIQKIFGLNVFDYKIFLFAKSLEKLYLIKYEESKNKVQNVENTNFEDMWDMDNLNNEEEEEEENTKSNINDNDENQQLKKIDINYNNLIDLCLINAAKRGAIFAPLLGLYKQKHNNSYQELRLNIKEMLKSLICDRVVLDSLYIPDKNEIEKYFARIDNLFGYLEVNGILNKSDFYQQINYEYILLDEYQNAQISCSRSNSIIETLISLTNYTERLMNKNLYVLINFNFFENVNLEKISKILDKLVQIHFFINQLIKTLINLKKNQIENLKSSNIQTKNLEHLENDNITNAEMRLYIFRIIFMMYFYLLFVSKIILKYYHITEIYQILQGLFSECQDIQKLTYQKAIDHLDNINRYIVQNKKRIIKQINGVRKIKRDEGISFYIQFLNLGMISQFYRLLEKYKKIYKISLSELIGIPVKKKEDLYFHEEFKFAQYLSSLMTNYISNFESNLENYIKTYMKSNLIYKIHDELKTIYTKKDLHNTYDKFKIIDIQLVFPNPEKLSIFEHFFNLNELIIKYISFLCKRIKYEKKKFDNENKDDDVIINHSIDENDDYIPESSYTKASINIVNQVFGNGFEIAKFNENYIVQDFCINKCDISNIAVSMVSSGHRKINLLNSLLISSRTDNFYNLSENNSDDWEEIYKKSFNHNYSNIAENLLKDNYNEIVSIIINDITEPRKKLDQFPKSCLLPPELYNEIQSEKFTEDISLNDYNSSSYCKVMETHPQLPLYLTSTEKGILSLWSYDSNNKKSLDEFIIEKKDSKISHNITKIKFSPYGNEFIAVDQEGNIFNWAFEHYKCAKLPKNSILKNDFIKTKDVCYLNNTGIIAATSNKKDHRHKTILYDFLLPNKKNIINEIYIGGNIILPISSDSSFIIVNDKPGLISFVDVRKKNEILKNFQAHDEEIKSIKLSEKENFLVTFGKDNLVKIWDLSNKINPLLIEEIQPFQSNKSDSKSYIHLEISDGFLFASKDNCIKLLRNNII